MCCDFCGGRECTFCVFTRALTAKPSVTCKWFVIGISFYRMLLSDDRGKLIHDKLLRGGKIIVKPLHAKPLSSHGTSLTSRSIYS